MIESPRWSLYRSIGVILFNYANISINAKTTIVPIFKHMPAIEVFFFCDLNPTKSKIKPKGTVINGPTIVNIPMYDKIAIIKEIYAPIRSHDSL